MKSWTLKDQSESSSSFRAQTDALLEDIRELAVKLWKEPISIRRVIETPSLSLVWIEQNGKVLERASGVDEVDAISSMQLRMRDRVQQKQAVPVTEEPLLQPKSQGELEVKTKHRHYYKDVSTFSHVDVYRVLRLFEVTDPCLQHAIKKLLVPGKRSGGKDRARDVQEAIYTLQRWQEMHAEDGGA